MRSDSVYELSEGLPVPVDDGACDHLRGMEMPAVALSSTAGDVVDVANVSRESRTVFFFFPRAGRPDEPPLPGWDDIPGARGCTPQSCAYRDHISEFEELGVQVFGVSTQDTEYQRELAARTKLPYPLLSDAGLALTRSLGLPTFEAGGMQHQLIEQVSDAIEPALRIFQCNTTHQAVDFVSEREQVLRQVASILAREARDQETGVGCGWGMHRKGVLSGVPARQERRRGADVAIKMRQRR